MLCPHCLKEIHPESSEEYIAQDSHSDWYVQHLICPNPKCRNIIIFLNENYKESASRKTKTMAYPKGTIRPRAAVEVPTHIAEDFNEACLVFNDSLKASAALSRRCLQNLLRDISEVKNGSLDSEIHQAMKILPGYIADAIDAVRNIGNFALHPMKSESTGEIVNVEPGEAEWLLEVLEQLFDHLYVQPAKLLEKRAKLDSKLADVGKPALKEKQ